MAKTTEMVADALLSGAAVVFGHMNKHTDEIIPPDAEAKIAEAIDDYKDRLDEELNQAESAAWNALSRYKFQMFGYWAGIWVHLNRISGEKRPNPFTQLVKAARDREGFYHPKRPAQTSSDYLR